LRSPQRQRLSHSKETDLKRALVSEWWALVIVDVLVFSSGDHSEGPQGAVVDGIDEFAVTNDFTNGGARIPQEHMSKPAHPNTYHQQTLSFIPNSPPRSILWHNEEGESKNHSLVESHRARVKITIVSLHSLTQTHEQVCSI